MSQFEIIKGSKRFAIFEGLIKNNTLIRLTLPSGDYDNLTLITNTRELEGAPAFQIDPPAGLFAEITKTNATTLCFEFHSVDHVTHRFEAELRAVAEDSVTLGFPQKIQRHQQRSNFRVKAFNGSYATVRVRDSDIRMEIDNISMGGVYCLCRNIHKSFFEENSRLNAMDLFLTLRNECLIVPIQRVEVRRLENRSKPRHFGVAFEFIKINPEARKQLVQQIYKLQREFLQNRLKLAD